MGRKRKLFLDVITASTMISAAVPLSQDKISKLPQSFDARDWASEFVEIFAKLYPGVDIDEGWMLGWFANALMAGYYTHDRRTKKRIERMEKKIKVLIDENKGLKFYAAKKAKSEGVK